MLPTSRSASERNELRWYDGRRGLVWWKERGAWRDTWVLWFMGYTSRSLIGILFLDFFGRRMNIGDRYRHNRLSSMAVSSVLQSCILHNKSLYHVYVVVVCWFYIPWWFEQGFIVSELEKGGGWTSGLMSVGATERLRHEITVISNSFYRTKRCGEYLIWSGRRSICDQKDRATWYTCHRTSSRLLPTRWDGLSMVPYLRPPRARYQVDRTNDISPS